MYILIVCVCLFDQPTVVAAGLQDVGLSPCPFLPLSIHTHTNITHTHTHKLSLLGYKLARLGMQAAAGTTGWSKAGLPAMVRWLAKLDEGLGRYRSFP
jgi:hypothetical protein